MKKIQFKIILILSLSFSLMSCSQNTQKNGLSVSDVIQKDVVSLITPEKLNDAPNDIQLIDIRTPQEFAQGHIKNAVNINFYSPDFMEKMNKLDKNKDLYLYCRSGNRTGTASKKLSSSGFKKIYDLKGGINNWYTKQLKIIH